jgi:hypothetical protein
MRGQPRAPAEFLAELGECRTPSLTERIASYLLGTPARRTRCARQHGPGSSWSICRPHPEPHTGTPQVGGDARERPSRKTCPVKAPAWVPYTGYRADACGSFRSQAEGFSAAPCPYRWLVDGATARPCLRPVRNRRLWTPKPVTCSRDSAAVAYMWPPSPSSCQLDPGASWQAATATTVPHMRGEAGKCTSMPRPPSG